jgi:mRNA interferase RelE/StbE
MYEVRLARQAERGLRRIRAGDPRAHARIVARVEGLGDQPRPPDAIKLRGVDPPAWRIRVGDYRVVYEIHEEAIVVLVINVAPRGEIYR